MAAAVVAPPTALNFTEAIKDSPKFRQLLGEHELYLGKIDKRISEVVRLVNQMNEYGKSYAATFYTISVAVNQLCTEAFANDPLAENIFNQISDAYAQTVHLHKVFVEQANASLANNLSNYLKNELTKVNDAKTHFESLSSTLDENLAKKATINRHKTSELLDAKNSLTAVGTCFAHTALDYVAQINIAHAHKNYIILEALWAFVKESSSFFSRGHAFFDEWTSIENGSISDTIDALKSKSTLIERKMQDRHAVVPKEVFQHPGGMPSEPEVVMEGYLFKRASNAFRSWNRRWFQISDNKLLYCHRCLDEETPTVMESDLKLCLVRPAPQNIDRACCFELVTPTKSHLLQADSEALMFAWMRALQRTIQHLHESDEHVAKPRTASSSNNSDSATDGPSTNASEGPSTQPAPEFVPVPRSFYEELRQIPGNDVCADCFHTDAKWVSLNLGVVICIECCGIHRSLGVQVSKVRSLTMDSIDADQRNVLLHLGNEAVNSIYLKHLPLVDVVPPVPKPSSTRPVREAWIRAKYLEKRFSRPGTIRALSSAQSRSEHLTQKPKIPALNVTALSPHRSQSWYNLSEEQSFIAEESDESPRSTASASSEVKWRSYPSLDGKEANGQVPKSKLLRKPIDISRLSSCGSDTNLGETDESTGGYGRGKELIDTARRGDLKAVLGLIANGAEINTNYRGTTALHAAVDTAQSVMIEFLILNGAKINHVDNQLDSPLHIAARQGHTLVVCQLMKRGADKHLKNHHGKIPLDLAVDGKYADIVTLLRIHDMRDEFNEEFNNPMDETVDDVILDIKTRAAKF